MRYLAVFTLVVSAVLLSSFPHPQPSLAQAALSPGCAELNDPTWDEDIYGGGATTAYFYAGETVTVTAGTPTDGTGTPGPLQLVIGVVVVDTDSFPGTLTYTFPADTNTTVSWKINLIDDIVLVTWTVSCTGAPEPPEPPVNPPATPVIVPGCDVEMNIPDTAVVGAFTQTVVADWAPGDLTAPAVILEAGKTAWVLGVDESGAYYKILWGCQTLWVPVGAMGPDFDNVWHGTPLPTNLVE